MSDPLIWRLVLLLVLIMVNSFFTMCETALITVNDKKIMRLADEGNEKAQRVMALIEKPSQFLSTTQICVTVAGLLASAFAARLARVFKLS